MAHIGKEIRLSAVGGFGGFQRLFELDRQIAKVIGFDSLLPRDVVAVTKNADAERASMIATLTTIVTRPSC